MKPDKYIAVAGNIGAGKSTLVQFLATQYGAKPFYEPNEENPYFKDFYADMPRWAFHSQIYFLSKRFRMHQELEKTSGKVVLDRTIYEDAEIFAKALFQSGNMASTDYQTYQCLYNSICDAIRPPDLLIFLRCSMRALKKRITLRGRVEEKNIPSSYLDNLQSLYDHWLSSYNKSEILVIETDKLDYVTDLVHRVDIIKHLKKYL